MKITWFIFLTSLIALLVNTVLFATIYYQLSDKEDWKGQRDDSGAISFDECMWVSVRMEIIGWSDVTPESIRARAVTLVQFMISVLAVLMLAIGEVNFSAS